MAKKMSITDNLYFNTALLYAWVVFYGVGADDGLMAQITWIFTNPGGWMDLLLNLSPILAMWAGCKGWMRIVAIIPLIGNVASYSTDLGEYGATWYFWASLIVALYASIKIAESEM